jgi:hypothetical protein
MWGPKDMAPLEQSELRWQVIVLSVILMISTAMHAQTALKALNNAAEKNKNP